MDTKPCARTLNEHCLALCNGSDLKSMRKKKSGKTKNIIAKVENHWDRKANMELDDGKGQRKKSTRRDKDR